MPAICRVTAGGTECRGRGGEGRRGHCMELRREHSLKGSVQQSLSNSDCIVGLTAPRREVLGLLPEGSTAREQHCLTAVHTPCNLPFSPPPPVGPLSCTLHVAGSHPPAGCGPASHAPAVGMGEAQDRAMRANMRTGMRVRVLVLVRVILGLSSCTGGRSLLGSRVPMISAASSMKRCGWFATISGRRFCG